MHCTLVTHEQEDVPSGDVAKHAFLNVRCQLGSQTGLKLNVENLIKVVSGCPDTVLVHRGIVVVFQTCGRIAAFKEFDRSQVSMKHDYNSACDNRMW